MVRTSGTLGGSSFFWKHVLPRIDREVVGSFLLHLEIWLGQNIYCISSAHGLYKIWNAPARKEFPKSEAQISFRGQDYEGSDWLGSQLYVALADICPYCCMTLLPRQQEAARHILTPQKDQ
jgi:hypothetical protein